MFVRKKTNRSGTISVVVVSKVHGKFTEVKKFGVAKSEEEADEMFREAQLWLRTHDGQQELDFDDRKGKEVEETVSWEIFILCVRCMNPVGLMISCLFRSIQRAKTGDLLKRARNF